MKSFRKWWKESPYGIAAAGFGFAVSMVYSSLFLVYLAETHNKEVLEDDIEHIDRVGGNAFRSPAACMAQGNDELACHASQEAALSKARERGVQVVYNNASECVAKHGPSCEKFTLYYFNGYNYEYPVYYKPLVVAWQAAQDDLKCAVPLYSSVESDKGYRFDGALVPLPEAR